MSAKISIAHLINGGIAQLARACGSYPQCPRFESRCRYQIKAQQSCAFLIRPVGQAVKTPPFHGGNMGSIPVRVTKEQSTSVGCFFSYRCAKQRNLWYYKWHLLNFFKPLCNNKIVKKGIFMWVLFALGSALFAGLTSVLAKCGIRKTDSDAATAIRTIVVLIFSWLMVWIVGSAPTITTLSTKTWVFLILSGLATGASWLCYFRALQLGNVNKVVPIDKSSTVLTILLAIVFLGEPVSWFKGIAVILIGIGTFMMIEKKADSGENPEKKRWLLYAVLSAVFASLTSILGKIGIDGVESYLGSAIRTCVVLVMAWLIVFIKGKQNTLKVIPQNELGFICLSGLATGASWLCYYKALQDGLASVVVPIDKLSILVSIGFSALVFKEHLSKKAAFGLALIVVGTLMMLIK